MASNGSTYHKVLELLPRLTEQERGRLRALLVRPGMHRPPVGKPKPSTVDRHDTVDAIKTRG